jgi:molybdopterin converting factor small subunit
MIVIVNFIGALRNVFKESKKKFDCENDISIMTLIDLLIKTKSDVKGILISQQGDVIRLNSLVLVNGVEISVLDGLNTKLTNGDEITFIPVIHGG